MLDRIAKTCSFRAPIAHGEIRANPAYHNPPIDAETIQVVPLKASLSDQDTV